MSASTAGVLGIKTADGRIAEVLDFGRPNSRTTVFTTVADSQRRARFEFYYRAPGGSGWIYLDALSLDRIQAAPAGEPDLEVKVRCDQEGNLLLGMGGTASAQPQSFVVEAATIRGFYSRATGGRAAVSRPTSGAPTNRRKPPRAPLRRAPLRRAPLRRAPLILIALLAAGVLLAFLLRLDSSIRGKESSANSGSVRQEYGPSEGGDAVDSGRPMPVRAASAEPPGNVLDNSGASRGVSASGGTPTPSAETAMTAQGVESTPAPGTSPQRPAPVQDSTLWASENPAHHEIVWGDTLWRITERYYGDRDLYPELAESNDLLDPDLIIAGESLDLPSVIEGRKRKSSNGEEYE